MASDAQTPATAPCGCGHTEAQHRAKFDTALGQLTRLGCFATSCGCRQFAADPAAGVRLLTWGCRTQPDLDALAAAVLDVSGGRVHLVQVDTGGDEYAVAVATRPLDADEALRLWEASRG